MGHGPLVDVACKSGGPQRGMLMHKWATSRKSGGPRTSVYFENGFACQIRLRNTGPYEQSYGPVHVNWRSYDLLFKN